MICIWLICIWFTYLRIEDMAPACPEAVSLQDPGASGEALFHPEIVTAYNGLPKKFDSCTTLPALGCGRAPGVRSLHKRCVWMRLVVGPEMIDQWTFGIVRVSNVRPGSKNWGRCSRAICAWLQRVEKLSKGWLVPGGPPIFPCDHPTLVIQQKGSTCIAIIASMFTLQQMTHGKDTVNRISKHTKTKDNAGDAMWCNVFPG